MLIFTYFCCHFLLQTLLATISLNAFFFPNCLVHLFWYWAEQILAITYSIHSFIKPIQFEMVRLHPAEKTKSQSSFPNEIPNPACIPTLEGTIEKKGRDLILIGALWVGRQREGRALLCSGLWITEADGYSRKMQPCSTTIILRGSWLPEGPRSWVLYSDVEMIFWMIHMGAKSVNGSII